MLIKNIALFLLITILSSCASAQINREAAITVRLEKIKPDDFFLKEKKINHPFIFEENELQNILNSLFFSERTGFSSWGDERKLFAAEDLGKITNSLKKGLESAKPDEIVVFEVGTIDGRTEGEVFVSGALNLRFNRINGIPFSVEREATGMPPRGEFSYSSDNYKIIPHIAHAYFISKEFFGKEFKHLNWVIAAGNTNDTLQTGAVPPQPAISPPKTKEGVTIPERLRVLKDLNDKGLISEGDYERKKKEILDSL